MKKISVLLAATVLASAMASAAWSKTLVYCSEGSPEGFDPGIYTAGTTFDAVVAHGLQPPASSSSTAAPKSSRASPKAGTISDDGLQYTFQLRPGVKFQTTDYFTPTPRSQRRRRDLLVRAPAEGGQSVDQVRCRRAWEYFAGMGFPELHQVASRRSTT